MVDLPQTTLYETFPKGGTMNHAWNAPNTLLSQYVAGIEPLTPGFGTFQIMPKEGKLTTVKANMLSVKGMIDVAILKTKSIYALNVKTPNQTMAIIGIPKTENKFSEIKVNGTVVWENGSFKNSNSAISFNGEDDDYIKFNVSPGKWGFIAKQ
jgi:hypothetical protein